MIHSISIPFGREQELVLETGRIARQAHGSVTARVGGTMVMANVVRSNKPVDYTDFFPLQVDYREKHYAVGRIPGNFFRREGRPGTPETINARLIDRAIRPLFPDGFNYEVQVYITILSMDQKNPPAIPSLIAASAALSISDIPFSGPVGAVRIGRVDDQFVLNPTFQEREVSALDLVVAGTKSAINMVESGSKYLVESVILDGLKLGHEWVVRCARKIEELVAMCGTQKMPFQSPQLNPELAKAVDEMAWPGFEPINRITEKKERENAVDALRERIVTELLQRFAPAPEAAKAVQRQIAEVYDNAYRKNVREMILSKSVRADGRGLTEVRPITVEPQFLPMAHGSVVFTRGQTQSLGVTTLGTIGDQMKVDDLMGVSTERFLLHYNFPSYCVGETRRIMGPGRRELGHGMLAQRALEPILPDQEKFPYTMRIVSEVLESNGSSSMASVCSGCLSLMDAGVPIKAPVAGIAMGLIAEGDHVAILSDIMGMEDHLGDMDFKVAGTQDGITALQMDIKVEGLKFDILERALAQALEGRRHILGEMLKVLPAYRPELSPNAPRIETLKIPVSKIGDLIGPSGKHIRGIVETTGAKVDVEDDGTVFICTEDGEAMQKAKAMVLALTADVEVGQTYTGKVVRITEFGAFVELLPKKDGLVHISELDFSRVEKVTDVCREGDMMKVKVIDVDPSGKVRLSRKAALLDEPGFVPPEGYKPSERPERSGHGGGGHDRGSRDRGGHDRGSHDRGADRGPHDRGGDRGPHDRGGDRGPHDRGGDRGPRR